jgi:AcrR family transcriptional regulator
MAGVHRIDVSIDLRAKRFYGASSMWELSRQVRLFGGRHGVPAAVVSRVQRERLLEAMVSVAADGGYQEASVERVVAQAGVSRRTFYDLFEDREDCFIAAYDEIMARVLTLVVEAFSQSDSVEQRMLQALEAFFRFCVEEPEAARACIVEVMAAGPRARARREQAMERITILVENLLREAVGDDNVGPHAARALIGGVHELVYLRVDQGNLAMLPPLAQEIIDAQMVPLVRV